jgi:hypothetical protein
MVWSTRVGLWVHSAIYTANGFPGTVETSKIKLLAITAGTLASEAVETGKIATDPDASEMADGTRTCCWTLRLSDEPRALSADRGRWGLKHRGNGAQHRRDRS